MAKDTAQQEFKKEDTPFPWWLIAILPIYSGVFLSLLIFPLSKDWSWLEGWLIVITFAVNMGISYAIINQKNPRVIRNRMKVKKEGLSEPTKRSAGSDWFLMPLMGLGFFGSIVVLGLDHRFGWSALPFWLEMVGLGIMNFGLIIMNTSILQNPYASKILDINKDQKLVDSGLYARVRHPLYLGGILLFPGIPVALGSWWALVPAVIAAVSLIIRIEFEEDMLVKGMVGYSEYQSRVRYKLFPGIY